MQLSLNLLIILVLIGVCSLFIYLHLLQKYHAEIDTLKAELKAARDKDGVFLPKEMYDLQIQARDKADQAVREKTMQMKYLEDKLEKFKVNILLTDFRHAFFKILYDIC